VENRFGTSNAARGLKDMADQRNLNATINRIKTTKAAFDAVPGEGERISGAVREKGKAMATTGAERAQELRKVMDKSVGNVEQGTAKAMSGQVAQVQAHNQQIAPTGGLITPVETGKGTNMDTKS
jgi:hypothetical protein